MDMAAEDNPFAIGGHRDGDDRDDEPGDEEEVLETPTEVRLLVGTLFELIAAGLIPEPGPLDWKRFQKYRAGLGGRPTVRRGDNHTLSTANDALVWRSTMMSLYGWIPREGQTEAPTEIAEVPDQETIKNADRL